MLVGRMPPIEYMLIVFFMAATCLAMTFIYGALRRILDALKAMLGLLAHLQRQLEDVRDCFRNPP